MSSRRPSKKVHDKPEEISENCLHMHAWQWVQDAHPYLLIFHVPNGELRHPRVAEKLKRMGVVAGVADFLAFPMNGRKVAAELKDDDGEQRKEQETFEKRWVATGGEYFIVRSLQEFKDLVNAIVLFG